VRCDPGLKIRRPLAQAVVAAALFCTPGCGDDETQAALPPEDCETAVGACGTMACAPPLRDGLHVEACSRIDFHSNPPTSGPHYPIWANFQIYAEPVPRGFYLHSLEHSAVVLAYSCTLVEQAGGDCAALVDSLQQIREAFGQDDKCDAGTMNRVMVTPDPLLDVPFAAAAWGHSLRADCLDTPVVEAFIDAHYGQNYEDFCSAGIDPVDPSSNIPDDCGM
jgi:hypothetical protein